MDHSPYMTSLWTLTSMNAGQRVWRRPLGISESMCHWSGCWNGAGDLIVHAHLRTTSPDEEIYNADNVRNAWTSVKCRFPLLAAEVREEDGGLHFVIQEQSIVTLQDGEVTLGSVSSLHDAEQFVVDNKDGPRPLSPKMLARVYVLGRTDHPDTFHVVLTVAHCITDAASTSTVLRSFLQTLATSFDPHPLQIEERLQMFRPIESWVFPDDMPLVKRRWNRAIGYALHVVRRARLTGGHALPGDFSRAATSAPGRSRLQVVSFPPEASALILSNCRNHNITLNAAQHIVGQIALSRLLCRRYLRGEISEEEWEYRKRQPMLFVGMINLRPYWDKTWFRNGGSGEVGLNVSYYQHILPFMPLGTMTSQYAPTLELTNGAPHFEDLVSWDRFLLRCEGVKRQGEKLFEHPRFLDMCVADHYDRLAPLRETALAWRHAGERMMVAAKDDQPLPAETLVPRFTFLCSTVGDMDFMTPLDYPLPARHKLSPASPFPHPHRAGYPARVVPEDVVRQCETPRLHIEHWQVQLRVLPEDLYVGTLTSQQQLQLFTCYNENVYSAYVIQEWLGEMKDAMWWYLACSREACTRSRL